MGIDPIYPKMTLSKRMQQAKVCPYLLRNAVIGSAPVPKRNGPVGTVHGGKNGGIGCIAGQKRTDFSSALPVNGNPAYQGRAYFAMAALITDIRLIKLSL